MNNVIKIQNVAKLSSSSRFYILNTNAHPLGVHICRSTYVQQYVKIIIKWEKGDRVMNLKEKISFAWVVFLLKILTNYLVPWVANHEFLKFEFLKFFLASHILKKLEDCSRKNYFTKTITWECCVRRPPHHYL